MYEFSYSDYIIFHVHIEKEKEVHKKKRTRKRRVISGKSLSFIELLSSTQLSSRNEDFVSPSQNLLKNKN